MIHIEIFMVSPFQENTYLLYDNTQKAIIFDPGFYDTTEQQKLIDFVQEKQLIIKKVINTHCHIDHIYGNAFVKKQFGVELYINQNDEFLLQMAQQQCDLFGLNPIENTTPEHYLTEKDTIKFGESELKIIHVPGHSPGSLVFYNETQKFLICGDVLFNGSIGRSDLPQGNQKLLVSSIKNKLLLLDNETIVFPGHGPHTTIGDEKKHNPFLK